MTKSQAAQVKTANKHQKGTKILSWQHDIALNKKYQNRKTFKEARS